MMIVSQRVMDEIGRSYYRAYGIRPAFIRIDGEFATPPRKPGPGALLQAHVQTNAYSLQEAVRWGEPFVFYPADNVVSWVVALVDNRTVRGGLLGGEVLAPGSDPAAAVNRLVEMGFGRGRAEKLVGRLKAWPAGRIREAAVYLQDLFYKVSGWKPVLLDENRLKAQQQRQISEAIEAQKKSGSTVYPIDKERALLPLIRAGDRNSARRVLNEMLGAMYLLSPKLVVLRARAIELMGYLTRTAVEDSPLLEPLIERNHQWMQKLIEAPDFETLSHVLMKALDDFMQGIYARGFNCYHPHVGRILDYIALHCCEKLSLRQIASEANLSVSRTAHLVKQHTGQTVWQHIMRMRVGRARQLLEGTSESCGQIAQATGFCDQSYFTKHFRRVTGATPAQYRRSLSGMAPQGREGKAAARGRSPEKRPA